MSNKKNDDYQIQGPPPKTSFTQFLYNKNTKEVLGRTAKSWFQILVFYVVLYAFLAGFFAVLMFVFFTTLESDRPKWTQTESLIGNNPGMGYRPRLPNSDVFTLTFNQADAEEVPKWVGAINTFLEPYNITKPSNMCNYTKGAEAGKSCHFPIPSLNECTEAKSYGYAVGKPCIFLKMNKIYDWQPIPYTYKELVDQKTEEGAEINMPDELKKKVLNIAMFNGELNKSRQAIVENNVWVSCAPSDKESANVTWTYDASSNSAQAGEPDFDEKYPIMGFPSYYYPFTRQEKYLSPFVVVQFSNLPRNTEVKMTCQLWAKGITIDRQRRLGMTNVEILSK